MATYTIDARRTFAAALLMSCGPKTKFGSDQQDQAADGRRKWVAQVAVTYLAEPGQRAQAEVINVTITSDQDPGQHLQPGMAVEMTDLRMGITEAEARERGGVRGGKPWFSASAVRPVQAAKAAA